MRDEQVRRYARHILLPDVGGLGQTALMVSSARLELRESEPDAEVIAATYLAAGGVGTIVLSGANEAQIASVGIHGPDTRLLTSGTGRDVQLAPRPGWWPSAASDTTALAQWRGAIAALRWMADIANDDTRRGSMTPIAIPEHLRGAIYAHALALFPAECCGYLTGPAGEDSATMIQACRNAQSDGAHPIAPERGAETGFVIAGAELLAFARSFDSDHPARVVYHSHTNGRAYFSEIDREMAAGPTYPVQHLVIGVAGGRVTEAAQFAWSGAEDAYVEIARWRP